MQYLPSLAPEWFEQSSGTYVTIRTYSPRSPEPEIIGRGIAMCAQTRLEGGDSAMSQSASVTDGAGNPTSLQRGSSAAYCTGIIETLHKAIANNCMYWGRVWVYARN